MNNESLWRTILKIDNEVDMQNFFKDLCTPAEIKAMKERWKVCQLLNSKQYTYREINELTGVSLATITRVARFLHNESNYGYRRILEQIN